MSNEKANRIANNSLIYKTAEFPDTHVAAMGHFSLFYKIKTDTIIISTFWDNRQDPKELLKIVKAR